VIRGFRLLLIVIAVLACIEIAAVPEVERYFPVRTTVRWFVWSNGYKAKVMAQPTSANGELKHIEWDGWGWAGMDTTVSLVFDPTDSLAAAAQSHSSGKFNGIPCEVFRVRHLRRHQVMANGPSTPWV
jgi:hypothetical protein